MFVFMSQVAFGPSIQKLDCAKSWISFDCANSNIMCCPFPPQQPVQGFDYAKKHMGRTGDEAVSVTKETLVLGLPVRDAPLSLSLDKKVHQDGTANKRPPSADIHKGG